MAIYYCHGIHMNARIRHHIEIEAIDGKGWNQLALKTHICDIVRVLYVCMMGMGICYYNMQDIYDTSATLKYYRKIWKIADIRYYTVYIHADPFHIVRQCFAQQPFSTHAHAPALPLSLRIYHDTVQWHRIDAMQHIVYQLFIYVRILRPREEKTTNASKSILVRCYHGL